MIEAERYSVIPDIQRLHFLFMTKLPTTENALIIRTDFSDESAWKSLTAAVREPVDPFIFNMEILDDRANDGASAEEIVGLLPQDYAHSFIVFADNVAISQSDHPLLVVDLLEEPGRHFRAIATEVPSIENNLSIGNMGFEEFANSVDENGVFRGFAGM